MAMTKTEVISWLKENADERGIANWKKAEVGLQSYGIGLTKLRKYAKQIGRDHKLAQVLWKTKVYEAKILGLLVDDPKVMTREQVEKQVEGGLERGYLAHVFSSCDASLAKTPFAFELAKDWVNSEDDMRRRCGYGLLYELSKKNPKGMTDEFLLSQIEHIRTTIHAQEMWVREAMNTALMGIGKRNRILNLAAIEAAKSIGPVDIHYGDGNSCQPPDVLKHLTADHLQAKFAN